MKKVNKEKINNIQVNSEYKYFMHDFIAAIVIMLIGFFLLLIGVEEAISVLLICSFVIFLLKISSGILFRGIVNKIIMTIYWTLFFIVLIGLILSIVNIKPNGYKFDSIIIKNDSVGFVTNIIINLHGDKYTTKLIKPTIFTVSSDSYTDVIYRIDNNEVMYQLYSTNIGLHIFYVGFAYLYIFSISLFFVIVIKFIFFEFIFFEIIPSIIKELKGGKKKI